MLSISMKSGIDEARQRLWWMRPDQVKLAAAKALTFTAIAIRKEERAEMQRVFDRPTPFTLNSLYLKSATPQRLAARVFFKDLGHPYHYLMPQVYGGGRELKQFEIYLQRRGILPPGEFAVPGEGAKLDQYGNMNRGQLIQILSALQAMPEQGYLANKSARRGARRNKKTDNIFAGKPHPGMPTGVWMRTIGGLKPLVIFVRAPQYRKRFDFFGIAKRVADREFVPQFIRALRSGSAVEQQPVAA
jgi:hypothetical protein